MIKCFAGVLLFCISGSGIAWCQEISYHSHIETIIDKRCTPCHSPGKIGPMPFTSFENVSAYGKMIAYVVENGYMPPWQPDPEYRHFREERTLPEEDKARILQWVRNGMPQGRPDTVVPVSVAKLPLPPSNETFTLDLSMAESFEQYGIYYDQYQVFAIPTGLDQDVYVSSIEFIPGNRRIVRHCSIAVDTGNAVDSLDQWDPRYGYYSFGGLGFVPAESAWHVWTPTQERFDMPKGIARFLPKKSRLILYIHYGPTGIPLRDSSHIRLICSTTPPERMLYSAPLINEHTVSGPPFSISKNEQVRVHSGFVIPFDMELHALMPQSQLLARSWEVFAVPEGGKPSLRLLKINDWDFHWRDMYWFLDPVILQKGTRVHAIITYDNTKENPFNPSEDPIDMSWGRNMFQEMALAHFVYTKPEEQADMCGLKILPGPVNVTDPGFTFKMEVNIPVMVDCTVYHFDNRVARQVAARMSCNPGAHTFKVDLTGLSKGNYYVEVHVPGTDCKDRSVFVYLDKDAM